MKGKIKKQQQRVIEKIFVIGIVLVCIKSSLQIEANAQDATTEQTTASNQKVLGSQASNCSLPCSSNELAHILAKFSAGEDVLSLVETSNQHSNLKQQQRLSARTQGSQPSIRAKCIKQLVSMIKNLASGELEMKTLLEFASSTQPFNRRHDLSSLRSSYASERNEATGQDASSSSYANKSCQTQPSSHTDFLLGEDAPGGSGSVLEDKQKFLPKFVANVDHWIDTIERFTLTREWTAIMKIFNGAESILSMFSKSTTASSTTTTSSNKANNVKLISSNYSSETHKEFLADLERLLPVEVQTLSNSLNQLFPWHVWPWNNIDLYSTLDTFLNHGIFAFSKTTSGPERRIDYLSQMLSSLFKSLKSHSFPKKCHDWSRIICDLESFHDRLILSADDSTDESIGSNSTQRQERIKELLSENNNKLTQELTCIMFSSLSMQQFGVKDKVDFKAMFESGNETLATGTQLQWDKQVRKALRLYRLSREALTDDQWRALYQQAQDAWTKTKISDRVIMLGRIVQLLTNCHMPREILESALWKDIYKYKNALNQVSDIVIEELNRSSDNGKFTIAQLAIGSKNLEQILIRFFRLLPRIIEALSKTIVDGLPELINKFSNEKVPYMKGPCKGYSFGDLIPSLSEYRQELIELESLVCKQLRTKPSITMAQINNLTNEFLAMVFSANFTQSFGVGALQNALPRFWPSPITGAIQASSSSVLSQSQHKQGQAVSSASVAAPTKPQIEDESNEEKQEQANSTTSSIIDELAANPRLAQIVAILQSSALDPPEVHAELPELDWVEAGTSVALMYETIQRLMSYEGLFTVFPELPSFQDDFGQRAMASKQLFERFGKRDAFQLTAYALDTAMPVALRTFQPLDSFHSECLSTFRDIFGHVGSFETPNSSGQSSSAPNVTPRESRQWQCAVSSINFASFALNNLIRTFNVMLKSIMTQMSQQQQQQKLAIGSKYNTTNGNSNATNHCVLFDGSITTLLDSLPQIVDLALETVLIASTNSPQHHQRLKETLCSSENQILDPFADRSRLQSQQGLRQAICHLLHESSLATCGEALRASDWTSTMKELNVTWFEAPVTSVEPSFCGILKGVHQFLDVFGKVKPSSISDGLIARVLNFNSYWQTLVNKAVSSIEKYREKRFELALQALVPIIGDNFLTASTPELRQTLKLSAVRAKSLLDYLVSSQQSTNGNNSTSAAIVSSNQTTEQQFKTLFNWIDRYSTGLAETLLRTAANNVTKLERLVSRSHSLQANNSWTEFCSLPIETYFDFEPIESLPGTISQNKAALPSQVRYIDMSAAKESICQFNWSHFDSAEGQQLLSYDPSSKPAERNALELSQYSDRQLVRVALTKWGQVLDVIMESSGNMGGKPRSTRVPKFLTLTHWQSLQEKLPQITPLKDEPTNFNWIWSALERLVLAWDGSAGKTNISLYEALLRTFDQLNCALDTVKGGITWDNLANIYSDRQDILAAHSTLNNGIALASAGANTFLAHKKFQRFLNDFVKPKVGLSAFCDMRDKARLETIFVAPDDQKRSELAYALENFQEFICDTNIETLVQNLNPISFCYQTGSNQTVATSNSTQQNSIGALTDIIDRFFKLSSLGILDAKLVETMDAKPPIFDKSQWEQLRDWWLNQTEAHQGNSGLALTLVRIFQTLDSINSEHVVWRAIFRSVYELSEVSAYLLRAAEMERNNQADPITTSAQEQSSISVQTPSLVKTGARNRSIVTAPSTRNIVGGLGQQRLASTLTNVMFPEVNNFISFRTFKQLRYLKSISDYFVLNHDAQWKLCLSLTNHSVNNQTNDQQQDNTNRSRFELIDYQLDSSEKLYSLLCHYHSSQWMTAMNIVLSKGTASLSKKTNFMTKYLSMFTKNFRDNENLQSFIHGQQLENIEAVANTTVMYLIALSKPFRTLNLSKISNMSWHSLPNLLEQIDSHLCLSKFDGNSSAYQLVVYEPKKPDIETIICKLPSWNITQVYNYFSENIDLQNMISIMAQNNRTSILFGMTLGASPASIPFSNITIDSTIANNTTSTIVTNQQSQAAEVVGKKTSSGQHSKTCMTPFRFASKWLKIVQDLIDETMSKGSRDKIKKCLGSNKKNQSIYLQSLRFLKLFNSALTTLNDFTVNNSWQFVRKSWSSISYALLNQTPSPTSAAISHIPTTM